MFQDKKNKRYKEKCRKEILKMNDSLYVNVKSLETQRKKHTENLNEKQRE